jgi:hypothetical protein
VWDRSFVFDEPCFSRLYSNYLKFAIGFFLLPERALEVAANFVAVMEVSSLVKIGR